MARTTKANNKNTTGVNSCATCKIVGELTEVYEGKKNNYLTIKVDSAEINPKTKAPYYNLIKVTASPDIELYDDGTTVYIDGVITAFFDKAVNRNTIIITATAISDTPF